MAFAAVLTALGYYIILRRFCQGLLKIFLQGAATGGSFPSLPPATPAFGVSSLPLPPPRRGRLRQVEQARRGDSSPAGDSGGRASNAGASPPPARDTPLLRCRPTGRQGTAPRAAFVRPAPGERTISNAEVPLPRSPLSLAAGTAHREPLPVGFAANREFLPPGTYMADSVSAASGLMPGCRGRSPRRNKL